MRARTGAVFLCACLAATAASAEDIRLGVMGAVNFADLALQPVDEFIGFSTLTRGDGGAVLEIGFNDNLSLVTQAMYLGKGTEAQQLGVQLRIALTYIEIPVLLKYAFDGGSVRPFVVAGPSIGFRDEAKITVRALGLEETEDVKDDVKSTDFSLWFGAGLEIPAGNARVFFEGGYALGLTDVDDVSFSSAKTRGFQVKAGVTFGL